jgi:hypothetical protein
MQPPGLAKALEQANRRREREGVRFLGWLALGIGLIFWSADLLSLGVLLPMYIEQSRGKLGTDWGGAGVIFVAFPALSPFAATIGCVLAVRSRRFEGKPIFHAWLAVGLNALLLIASLVLILYVVRWR